MTIAHAFGWLLLSVLLIVGGLLFFGTGQHAVLWYAIQPFRAYDTVKAYLSVDGEQITLIGTSACEWVQKGKYPLVHSFSGYRLVGGAIAGRLSSGKVVVLKSRAYCGNRGGRGHLASPSTLAYQSASTFAAQVIAPDLETDILLLDDAIKPTTIELIRFPDHFANPSARVKILRYTRQLSLRGKVTDVSRTVPWLGDETEVQNDIWQGVFAETTPRSHWGQDKTLAERFDAVSNLVPDVSPLLSSLEGRFNEKRLYASGWPLIGVQRTNRGFEVDLSSRSHIGIVRLAPFGRQPVRSPSCNGHVTSVHASHVRGVALWIGESELPGLSMQSRGFDPASGAFFTFAAACVSPRGFFRPD